MTGYRDPLIRALRATMSSETLSQPDDEVAGALTELGLQDQSGVWTLDRDSRVRLAFVAVERGVEIESVAMALTWKDFERLVAGILEENGYACVESFRRRGTSSLKGMEIDVIGHAGRRIVCVDAKMWNVRGGKASALGTAALRQKERTQRLVELLPSLSARLRLSHGKYHLVPAVVTWLVEDLEIFDGVPVVPVFKLNTFLIELDAEEDAFVSFVGDLAGNR